MVEQIGDPLAAMKAYQQAAKRVAKPQSATEVAAVQEVAPNFSGMVKDVVNNASQSIANAEYMAKLGATGQAPLVDVATALSAAEVTLETVVAVRDRVVSAYQEILRMPV